MMYLRIEKWNESNPTVIIIPHPTDWVPKSDNRVAIISAIKGRIAKFFLILYRYDVPKDGEVE